MINLWHRLLLLLAALLPLPLFAQDSNYASIEEFLVTTGKSSTDQYVCSIVSGSEINTECGTYYRVPTIKRNSDVIGYIEFIDTNAILIFALRSDGYRLQLIEKSPKFTTRSGGVFFALDDFSVKSAKKFYVEFLDGVSYKEKYTFLLREGVWRLAGKESFSLGQVIDKKSGEAFTDVVGTTSVNYLTGVTKTAYLNEYGKLQQAKPKRTPLPRVRLNDFEPY